MTKKREQLASDFIVPLHMNGLSGHMLVAPATGKRNRSILVVYDQHANLETIWPIVQELRRYGPITAPDLPGMGGMSSFYKIGRKPTIDNFASYLAAFIKLRYKRKNVTIIGIGFGFVVATRMLQRHPDLAKKVEMLVSIDGYTHHKDRSKKATPKIPSRLVARVLEMPLPAIFYKNLMMHPARIAARDRSQLHIGDMSHKWPKAVSADDRSHALKVNKSLWRRTDQRTRLHLQREFSKLDNCQQPINLEIYSIRSQKQRHLDDFRTDQHLKVAFKKVRTLSSSIDNYSLVGILPVAKSSNLLPNRLKTLLSKDK